jgi:GntR family transcriptional regulator
MSRNVEPSAAAGPAAERIALDRSSPLPLYVQIKQHLLRLIAASGGGSERFHTEIELCRMFGVSRMTVRQAIEELVDEGLLARRRGSGTYITPPRFEEQLSSLLNFEDQWEASGRPMGIEPLAFEMRPCPAEIASELGLETGDAVRYVARLRLAGALPIGVDHRFIPADLAEGIGKGGVTKSLLRALWNQLDLSHGELHFEAATAGEEEARWLGVAVGSPLMRRRLQYFARTGRPVMAGDSVYRADLVRYSVHVPLSREYRRTLDSLLRSEEAPREVRLRREVAPRRPRS